MIIHKTKGEITDGFKVLIVGVGDSGSTEPYIFCRRVFKELNFLIRPKHSSNNSYIAR
jgi:hypothetical protein